MENFNSSTQVYGRPLMTGLIVLIGTIRLFGQSSLSSQHKKALKYYEKAKKATTERRFDEAIALYERATAQDDRFFEAYLKQAGLYHAMGQEDSVYSYLSRYVSLCPNPSKTVLKRLAFLAFERGNDDRSRKNLDRYVAEKGETDKEIILLDQSLLFAKKQMETEGKVKMNILPPQINTYALQYLPSLTVDGQTMVYTKQDHLKGQEDIVVSHFKDGQWTPSQSISEQINTPYFNEGASTISADGTVMIFTSCDRKESLGSCDLYISRKGIAGWSKPKNLKAPVNTRYWESQPSLSSDGKTLYFSSNRPGGYGGRDLWVARHSSDGWSKPVNLGGEVNSFKEETTPFIHPNTINLFYSSNGFPGRGGYDLLKTEKANGKWQRPVNLGYPINTRQDEVALLIASDGMTAYFAKETRKNKQIVESNIVRFTLPDDLIATQATYITGVASNEKTRRPLRAKVEIYDVSNNTLIYEALSDSLTGRYTMVLPAGMPLACYVKKKGYLFHDFSFHSESNTLLKPDTIEIKLHPIEKGKSIALSNIYFDFDESVVDARSNSEIKNVVEMMKENPGLHVEIRGHSDNVGSKKYNLELSEKRAKEVFIQLTTKGVAKDRISYKGYGDEYPTKPNDSEKNRALNRRIECYILDIK